MHASGISYWQVCLSVPRDSKMQTPLARVVGSCLGHASLRILGVPADWACRQEQPSDEPQPSVASLGEGSPEWQASLPIFAVGCWTALT